MRFCLPCSFWLRVVAGCMALLSALAVAVPADATPEAADLAAFVKGLNTDISTFGDEAVEAGLFAATPAAAPAVSPVQVQSPSAVLLEVGSGRVLFSKAANERRHPASVTKIMTLLVAYDALKSGQIQLTDVVTVSAAAESLGGTTAFLETGETATVADLLRAIAIGSANDASVALAEHVAGTQMAFVEQMNQKARDLGMKDTQFQNPTGFDADGHFTSAYDIALMSRYLVAEHPQALSLTSVFLDYMPHNDGRRTELLNRNRLVKFYPGADGLKTGWTQLAGYSVSATAQRAGTRMIAVVLGAADAKIRQDDAWTMLDYGFAQYTTVTLAAADAEMGQVPVVLGADYAVAAVPSRVFAVSVPKTERDQVKVRVELAPQVRAPISAGQPVGRLVAVVGERTVAELPLVAAAGVPRLTLGRAFGRAAGTIFRLGR